MMMIMRVMMTMMVTVVVLVISDHDYGEGDGDDAGDDDCNSDHTSYGAEYFEYPRHHFYGYLHMNSSRPHHSYLGKVLLLFSDGGVERSIQGFRNLPWLPGGRHAI